MATPEKRFKIALSYPGERRPYVERVAARLAERVGEERLLYDRYHEAEFARPDLDTYLQALYHDQSELIVVFLCAEYDQKEWCGLEWRALRDLIKRRRSEEIMPLRFDHTEVPGLFSIDGSVWLGEGGDERAPEEIADLILQRAGVKGRGPGGSVPPKIDISHLPKGADQLIGRDRELRQLDEAWADPGTALFELVAPGGTGKTALMKEWLGKLRRDGWRGATRVYGWSFYSQGSDDKRQASEDGFLDYALREWFELEFDASAAAADKGRLLGEAVAEAPTLLILDGVEPLQYPPGAMAGRLKAPGTEALLHHLATAGRTGLCLITTRESLTDLTEYARNDARPDGNLRHHALENLEPADGARLLHTLGASRAGEATIGPKDQELVEAAEQVKGHALTLNLLGRYLKLAHGGDIRRRDRVEFQEADAEVTGGHAFRVMAAYETWFEREGEAGARYLAALRLLGFFDRPADRDNLAALRAEPPITGLTESLVELKETQWNTTLEQLAEYGLILPAGDGTLDAHPLVREELARRLREERSEAWREGHRRLYEQLKGSVPHQPDDLAGLQPLYRAVAHGALAGFHKDVLNDVFVERIMRGTGNDGVYSTKKLGAIGDDLGAVACLFEEPWRRPATFLSAGDQTWLINQAAFRLRALGRLGEALEPTRAGAEMRVEQEDWWNAAVSYNNLSELGLTLGAVDGAVADAERAVVHAEQSEDAFLRMVSRAALADALHQWGEAEAARDRFAEANAIQAERQPFYPLLYSFPGFRYCDLLLAEVECEVWSGGSTQKRGDLIELCEEIETQAIRTLAWIEGELGLLDVALNYLTLGCCVLYRARLQGAVAGAEHIEAAVAGLRAAGTQDQLPRGLLSRAWLRHASNDPEGATADLDEAWRVASRGGMKLHMADIHLYRARLFKLPEPLKEARKLIEECHYYRRLPELEDAEAELGVTPPEGSASSADQT